MLGDVAKSRGLSGLDAARGYALLNMTLHDALLTSFTGKFVYGLWRPVTAIREADTDGNTRHRRRPELAAAAGHAAVSERARQHGLRRRVASRTLERLFGQDNIPFSVTWTGTTGPTTTRNYNGFRELGDQEAYSRIWGGIHFLFETLSSIGQCPQNRRLRLGQRPARDSEAGV